MEVDCLYDFSASFWENFRRGPRPLAPVETRRVKKLAKEVRTLEESGASIAVDLYGKKVDSPVGIAAGPAPNALWLQFFSGLGYDILTHKTVRDRYWEGHRLPNLVNVDGDFVKGFKVHDRYTGTITNSLGMPSAEPRVWKREVKKILNRSGDKFVAVSVTATAGPRTLRDEVVGQFAALSGAVKEIGADAVELNLSCPNILAGEGGELYAEARLCGIIVDAVRARVGSRYPILLKAGYLDDYSPLVGETWDRNVGYVVVNSIASRVTDSKGGLLFADRGGKAGVSGAALLNFTMKAVGNLERVRSTGRDFKIFAVGGVSSCEGAKALIDRGANVIESATGALADPTLALTVKKGLLESEVSGPR